MDLFRKNHGAISVFLVMILVPCMLVASIFVDISRVRLGRAVAESSADLALNTLLTYYDYDLSEAYGLMGSCQNIGDYFDMVSECYDQALHSQDVEDEEVQLLYQQVMKDVGGRFSHESISDFLLIQNQAEGAAVSAIEGADMRNPAILQKQIVEFMKYRAPIIIVQELIELLTSEEEKGGVEDSEEGVANKPMMDAQEEYYKAEGELLAEANKSYWALREYTKVINDADFTADTLREYADRLKEYRDTYEEINRAMIKNLYNTEGLAPYTRPNVALDAYVYSKEEESISYAAPSAETGSGLREYRVKAETVNTLLNELKTAIDRFDDKKDALTEAGKDLMSKPPGAGEDDSYWIQWWVRMNAKINGPGAANLSGQVTEAGKKMMDAYGKVKAMILCVPDPDVPSDWQERAQDLIKQAEDRQETYLSKTGTADDPYIKTVSSLESISNDSDAKSQISHANLYVKAGGGSKTIPNALGDISTDLKAMKEQMDRYAEQLNDIIEGNSERKIPSLDRIKELVNAYGKKLDTWESKAEAAKTPDGQNTELSAEHRETIEKIRNGVGNADGYDSEKIVRKIEIEEIDALKERLEKIRSQFQAMSKAIDEMAYGNGKLADISDFASFKAQASGQVQADAIPLANRALAEYASAKFAALFKPASGEVVSLQDMSDLTYSPVLNYDNDRDAVPTLYHFYYQVFKEKKPSDVERQQKALDDKGDAAKEHAKGIKNKNRYKGPEGRDVASGEAGDAFHLSIGTLVKLASRLVAMDVSGIRDDLYVTEYIMNMFSYGAFENENYYDLVEGAGKLGELRLADGAYRTVYERDYKGAADQDGTWLSQRPEDDYNKTLTNEMINESNHYAYLAEIEYILFGAGNETSVKKAYGEIYEIRFFLNYASAFANFWGRSTATGTVINTVADTVAAATAFIIPAPLTKIALLTMLTIFETGKDMDRLEAGFPVELYKDKDDWWISLEINGENPSLDGFYNALSGGSEKIEEAQGLRYSDYLTLFVFLGLNDGDTAEGMYRRMGDVIEKNMQLRLGDEGNSYSLKKTLTYFQLKSRLRVRPLMLTLPYFLDYVENPDMKDDWCTFDVEAVRGY